jgi:hypothetical protein
MSRFHVPYELLFAAAIVWLLVSAVATARGSYHNALVCLVLALSMFVGGVRERRKRIKGQGN